MGRFSLPPSSSSVSPSEPNWLTGLQMSMWVSYLLQPTSALCCRFHFENSLQAALKMSETSYPPDSCCNEKWKVCVFSAPSGFNQGNILNMTGFLNRLPSAFLPDDSRSLFWSGRCDGNIKSRLFSFSFLFYSPAKAEQKSNYSSLTSLLHYKRCFFIVVTWFIMVQFLLGVI